MLHVRSERLLEFAVAILEAAGYPAHDAIDMAGCLLTASLRAWTLMAWGVSLHTSGWSRAGSVRRHYRSRVVMDTGAVAIIDGGGGFGFVPALRAMRLAMDKARVAGIGAVGVRNSGHFGMAACYPLEAARQGMLAMSNADPLIAAPGFRTRMVGNNPIALAAPAGHGRLLVLDIASSAASMAKIRRSQADGRRLPLEWGVDAAGLPTDDPSAVIEGGALLPFAGHKGFGIALFVETFAGILTGGPYGRHAHAGLHYGGAKEDKCGHFLAAVNTAAFLAEEEFGRRMDTWIAELKSHTPFGGTDLVRLPGEGAEQEQTRRLAEGIPVSAREAEGLKGLADDSGVALPWGSA